MERIVFLERDSVGAEFRRPALAHEWVEYAESTQGQLVERLRGATVLIAWIIAVVSGRWSVVRRLLAVAA